MTSVRRVNAVSPRGTDKQRNKYSSSLPLCTREKHSAPIPNIALNRPRQNPGSAPSQASRLTVAVLVEVPHLEG
ncbi:hypothetical protein OS493_038872 [Desmophyllum pertusum]|uniref:Uncharacterized protein n=1 Tax=Desmophyllum pertusum TaxID=174260 RepID=A0A9W9ZVK3_9CNID|nr:hypothetical protein OS493_038872 [Desmophyllum pertusum]